MEESPNPSPPRRWFEHPLLPVLALIALVGAAYANSLRCEFVWDDIPTIVNATSFERLGTVFDPSIEPATTSGRPVVSLSLWLNFVIAKRSIVAFHVGNILIHAVATLALFGLVRRTALLPSCRERFGRHATWIALTIAGLWAAHPLQTEAVTYVVQRAESLMGMFYLLTLYCFLRSATSSRPAFWTAASVICCAIGMGVKEVMVSAPVIAWLYDRAFLAGSFRAALRERKFTYLGLAATWSFLAYLVISLGGNRSGGTGGFSAHAAWLWYWATQFQAIATYLKLAVFPHPLVFRYGDDWRTGLRDIAPYAAIVIPLIVATLYAVVRKPRVGFLAFWFFAVLAPTSIIPGTVDVIVEHRMYLALAPLLGLVVGSGYAAWGVRALWTGAAATLVFAGVTVARNVDYRTAIALWQHTVKKRPAYGLGQYNLGACLLNAPEDRVREALPHLQAAVELLPTFSLAQYTFGSALARFPERHEEAFEHLARAIELAPGYAEAWNDLGALYQAHNRLPQAIQQFRAAIQAQPSYVPARFNLARALSYAGDNLGAVQAYEDLLRLTPNQPHVHFECGSLLANTGHPAEAIAHFESALKLAPNSTDARYALGLLLAEIPERADEAIPLLRQAVQEKPDFAEARYNLGNALARSPSRFPEATTEFQEALRLKPDYADAHFNLATILETLPGREQEALNHYREYVRQDPSSSDGHLRLARMLARKPATFEEARTEARAAWRLNPDSAEAQDLIRQLDGTTPPR